MKVVESKSDLVLAVEDIITHQHQLVYAQRIIDYPVMIFGEQASNELKEHAMHYDASYLLVHDIHDVCKPKREYEMLASLLGFKVGKDETLEALACVIEDMPGIFKELLRMADRKV